MKTLSFGAKLIRAQVISEHVRAAGISSVVCFTCGNAADALRSTGLEVVEIGPRGALVPGRWWCAAEIARVFPVHFDATSGHLPMPLMLEIAKAFRAQLGELRVEDGPYVVPTGSGETLVCLAFAYPGCSFIAQYDDANPATAYNPGAPLNDAVLRVALFVERKNPAQEQAVAA